LKIEYSLSSSSIINEEKSIDAVYGYERFNEVFCYSFYSFHSLFNLQQSFGQTGLSLLKKIQPFCCTNCFFHYLCG